MSAINLNLDDFSSKTILLDSKTFCIFTDGTATWKQGNRPWCCYPNNGILSDNDLIHYEKLKSDCLSYQFTKGESYIWNFDGGFHHVVDGWIARMDWPKDKPISIYHKQKTPVFKGRISVDVDWD